MAKKVMLRNTITNIFLDRMQALQRCDACLFLEREDYEYYDFMCWFYKREILAGRNHRVQKKIIQICKGNYSGSER